VLPYAGVTIILIAAAAAFLAHWVGTGDWRRYPVIFTLLTAPILVGLVIAFSLIARSVESTGAHAQAPATLTWLRVRTTYGPVCGLRDSSSPTTKAG
jgi:hypothetical protein